MNKLNAYAKKNISSVFVIEGTKGQTKAVYMLCNMYMVKYVTTDEIIL